MFQKLGRSLENVEFSVSELFIVRYQKTICGLTIIFFSGLSGERVFSSFRWCKRFFQFATYHSHFIVFFSRLFFAVLFLRYLFVGICPSPLPLKYNGSLPACQRTGPRPRQARNSAQAIWDCLALAGRERVRRLNY